MSGRIRMLDKVAALDGNRTATLSSGGAATSAAFYYDIVISGTATYTMAVSWRTPEGNDKTLAQAAGITATGAGKLTAQSPFDTGPVPHPSKVVWTRTAGTGTITGSIMGIYGD